jgi:hypothetical protein
MIFPYPFDSPLINLKNLNTNLECFVENTSPAIKRFSMNELTRNINLTITQFNFYSLIIDQKQRLTVE